MTARVGSFVLSGIAAEPCEVEVHVHLEGPMATTVVGLPDAAVRESVQRVRSAVWACGYGYPDGRRVTINLAPAHVRKEGPAFDLAIALGLLADDGALPLTEGLERTLVTGELALDGRVRPVRGVIAGAMLAARRGIDLIVPAANAGEAAVAGGRVFAVRSLAEAAAHLSGRRTLAPEAPVDLASALGRMETEVDFADVRGQQGAKRALTIAAAGGHNLFMLGPAGTGKSMMARALPGILPPLTAAEALEVTQVHSVARTLPRGRALLAQRPVRAPHHTASTASVIGGGPVPRPGEVSLAHHGVLFLDETPEFPRAVLEALRQPLEDGVVTIARAQSVVRFPARFLLLGAMNPTRGGRSGAEALRDGSAAKYLARLSGPLVDRIDLHVEVPPVDFRTLAGPASRGTGTAPMRAAVVGARAIQEARHPGALNAHLSRRRLDAVAVIDAAGLSLLEDAVRTLGLSARAYDKVRRVARTIADLDGDEAIGAVHVAEAVGYRLLDRRP